MTEEEICQIKEDVDDTNELLIIDNVLDLKNLKAHDIMCPRADIIGFETSSPSKDVLSVLKANAHTAYPVYEESLDDILGIVRAKDVYISLLNSKKLDMSSIMEDCFFVSPAMPVLDLLLKMRSDDIDTALVVDEFGGVDGLISIKDIIEEIVGEIKGVSNKTPDASIKKHKNGTITVDARMLLDDFEEEVGVTLTEDEDIDTIGGVIFDEIGRIPVKGELITLENGALCEIIEANPRTVKTVKLRDLNI